MNKEKTHNQLKAVLFDVDGTLADTEQDGHRPAFNAAFQEFGLSWEWDIPLYGELLQVTGGKERIRYYIEKYMPEELARNNLDEWVACLHKTKTLHFKKLMEQGEIPLRPGVKRLIHDLRDQNIKLAIATTTTPENVTYLLQSTLGENANNLFDVIGAGDIVPQKKPAPDIYFWVLNKLNLEASQCIAIEDSENGLLAARAANLPTLITVNNYTCQQNFAGAVAILSDLGEPDKIFTQLSNNSVHFDNQWIDVDALRKLTNT
ncbi:haloacid dehalogenase superfamily, subfamily IA, variant 3 with third motif having DD or ED [Nitrosomonas aestuarii]|uniref:Haloacid dehalogenase superfamily, subfamily IA, variant 3 with third motif having DD or ED n=1 Tax=Nitrosomonas aestuarii TaxID=52441 RepID=A0A1I4FP87_9PROT|nr:HAD family hydrolase [Nitrosomonas aestuarii]SFL18636.1 haloacid dehalogenase superfamily, subfamily IA, variant 3 with third motif having DD or ED [Nitrosomonas aestuarii]